MTWTEEAIALEAAGAAEATKAKTDVIGNGLSQIPLAGLLAVGLIFKEGEAKYGFDNWKKGVGDKAFQDDRKEHALTHFLRWLDGDRSEPHLAKVAWFCLTQIWTEAEELCRGSR